MSSWIELEQRMKQNDKAELKEKILKMNYRIKNLELSFKETLDTLNNDHETSLSQPKKSLTKGLQDNRKSFLPYKTPFTEEPTFPRKEPMEDVYKEYLLESKLRYFSFKNLQKMFFFKNKSKENS